MSKLNLTIILGTTRPKRQSEKAANFIKSLADKREEFDVTLVDPVLFNTPFDGNNEEVVDPKYIEIIKKSDAFVIVVPEYNRSFTGSLKRLLDTAFYEYNYKPVTLAGVSSGTFGGARAIELLIPVIKILGMYPTVKDLHFPKVQDLFNEDGSIDDPSYEERVNKAFDELIFIGNILKEARKQKEQQKTK